MKEKEILQKIQKIIFFQKYYNIKNIRPENREKLDFFLLLLFKNKNLEFEKNSLKKLFSFLPEEYISKICNNNPNSISARKIGYFYEILENKNINFIGTKATYTKILDENIFFTSTGTKNKKFKIIDNLLGKINGFNPYVKKTTEILEKINYDYEKEIKNIIESKTKYLIEKSIGYLFLKETKSSYQIEGEEYDSGKNSKFLHALQNIKIFEKLDIEKIIEIHNSVMTEKKHEKNLRNFNNYISSGNELMGESIIDYISPKAKDAEKLIIELIEFYYKNKNYLNKILLSSIISSYFVFIHPFSDGNGRTSRYLFHYILKDLGFGSYDKNKNIIIPISAYIVNNRDEYYYNLNKISKNFWKNIKYEIKDNGELEIFGETLEKYFYADYTSLIEYYSKVFYNSFFTDFKQEINFLEKYYNFIEEINNTFDFTNKEKGYIGKFLHENNGVLSKAKLKFLEKNGLILEKNEIEKIEKIYNKYFL